MAPVSTSNISKVALLGGQNRHVSCFVGKPMLFWPRKQFKFSDLDTCQVSSASFHIWHIWPAKRRRCGWSHSEQVAISGTDRNSAVHATGCYISIVYISTFDTFWYYIDLYWPSLQDSANMRATILSQALGHALSTIGASRLRFNANPSAKDAPIMRQPFCRRTIKCFHGLTINQ